MSSLNFTSSFPRSQNGQNGSFWNPTSPLAGNSSLFQRPYQASLIPNPIATHHHRQSEYLSRTMRNALGTIPLPNFNFDDNRPRRITSPLSNVKPIGFERKISRQMGYSHSSISEVGEEGPSVEEEEESGDSSPIITQSLVRGLQPYQHRASSSRQEDEMSVLDIKTSLAGLTVNEQSSPSKEKKSYGTIQGYAPYTHAHTEKMGMHPSSVATRNRDITAIFRGPQVQSSLPLNRGAPLAPPQNIQPLGHRAVGYEHKRVMTSYGGPGQYMSQFNAQVVGNPSETDGGYNIQSQAPQLGFEQQKGNRFSSGLNNPFRLAYSGSVPAQLATIATHTIATSTIAQSSNNRSGAQFQSGVRPTDQLRREQGRLAALPASTPAVSHNLGENEGHDSASRFDGEANLPKELNCAVWIKGISKDIALQFLYQELFRVISTGPIIAAYIQLGGDQHPHHTAKVVFKHPKHATRLSKRASYPGIYIKGHRIWVERNRAGHREYPLELHYRSRVILVEVFNNPGMDLEFWRGFITKLCVWDVESYRHLSYSTPQRMVMEFRFARIFGQASTLLAGIRNTESFEGIVTARYIPDVPCDICDIH